MLANHSGTRPGFTLFEILMVCVVMGVLFTISFQSFSNARDRSSNAQVDGNLRLLQQALVTYEADNEKFPHALTRVESSTFGTVNTAAGTTVLLDPVLDRRYLPGNQMPKTPWGASFQSNNLAVPRLDQAAGLWRATDPELVTQIVKVPPNPVPLSASGVLPAMNTGRARYTVATFGAILYDVNGPAARTRYVLIGIGKQRRAARVVAIATNGN